MTALVVALDLLREAAARKWFLALGAATTLALVVIGCALRLEVVDGALAATRFFGSDMDHGIRAVDVALRPVFEAAAYLVFYGGAAFGVLACAGFGPSLLAPGRIEHLLSLPVRRHELLGGTLLGVIALSAIGGLYGTGGLTLIMGFKTGYWTWRLVAAGLLATASFAAIYAAMLSAALFARSAPLSGAIGGILLAAGIAAGYRDELGAMFEPGLGRWSFEIVTAPLPRLSRIAEAAGDLAAARAVDGVGLLRLLAGQAVFGLAAFALGAWRFERKEF
jgi:Cu-processing system permease protein